MQVALCRRPLAVCAVDGVTPAVGALPAGRAPAGATREIVCGRPERQGQGARLGRSRIWSFSYAAR